ncbi:MAG TPA: ATP-binding protein, partial [Planctomycetaceae bacterium]|nr:ATP-binding protein [Planctomycetaceae bacterium]
YQLYRPKTQSVSEFELGEVTRQVCRLLQNTAHRAGVTLAVQAEPHLPPVRLSEGEVKQILYNLLQNAFHASGNGQTVTVRIAHVGDELHVAVADEGPGIPADVLPKIFEPFFSTKQTGVNGGMGLGLSVSQGLIAAMGGRIDVATSPRGTTFTAVFPISLESHATPPP